MQTDRRLRLLFLAFSLIVMAMPVIAQQVIATVPVGIAPNISAVNPVTNKIYAPDYCGGDPNCASVGTLAVIDGATNNALFVNVGFYPVAAAVNTATNKIYVLNNNCYNYQNCAGAGTVTVIDGATNNVITTVSVGNDPFGISVNSATNKIYVANECGNDVTCAFPYAAGTVTVIDGATNNPSTVNVGFDPTTLAVNQITNKIYVANQCGSDPNCAGDGTVSVIDGASNGVIATVPTEVDPYGVAVNSATNKIYVTNYCGSDTSCETLSGTVTVIDGATLATTAVTVGAGAALPVVNATTNKIYVPNSCGNDPVCGFPYVQGTVTVIDGVTNNPTSVNAGFYPFSVDLNSTTNKVYVGNECGDDPNCAGIGTVTVIDGASLAITNLNVGTLPYGLAVNSTTNRVYVPNNIDNTVSVIDGTPPTATQFVPLSQPCRAVDTRPSQGGMGPIQGGTSQNFPISGENGCPALPNAAVYSMNVTVVPGPTLGYLTIWPAGQSQPVVSTLNSVDGRVKADAAIVPAGTGGAVSIYVTDTTNVIVDVNGYFTPITGSTLAFYPLAPCRVADTRKSNFPPGLGPPSLSAGVERPFPILNATNCNIPSSSAAYSLNFTVVPSGTLGYLTVWPTGQTRPTVSTLNDVLGNVIANAAIVVAGTGSEVSAYATSNTDLIIDINGYFAPAGPGGLSLYGVQPCRTFDTRHVGNGQPFTGVLSPPVDVVDTGCGASSLAQAYVFNATVVPSGSLGYLTLWPDGENQPVVSTLNAADGSITNNMAIVPTNNGQVDAFANGLTQLLLDISSYFAP